MAELWPNYGRIMLGITFKNMKKLVLHGRIMADILAGGRIVAELLKPTGQNVLDRSRC
jgi:adenine-specific DNA methylase